MAETSLIEWTDATWNPVTGCSVVSPGCTNCYAMRLAGTRLQAHPSRKGLTAMSKAGLVWNGRVRLNEEWLTQPMSWTRPRRIFVCAHGDLFHERVPDEWIDTVFAVMALAPWHTFQVLTKRAARMRAWAQERWQAAPAQTVQFSDGPMHIPAEKRGDTRWDRINLALDMIDVPNGSRFWTPEGNLKARAFTFPLPNVWLGVSAEDQVRADERIPDLLATPAAVRYVSAEPLLGPLNLTQFLRDPREHCQDCGGHLDENDECRGWSSRPTLPASPGLDWIIAGGESGPGARPMRPAWARSLRDQCAAAGVPFHFKQWGAWLDEREATRIGCAPGDEMFDVEGRPRGGRWHFYDIEDPLGGAMIRIGKKAAGRLLDGVEHNDMPGGAP